MDGPWDQDFVHEPYSSALQPVLEAVMQCLAGMGAEDLSPSLAGGGGGEHLAAETGFMLNGQRFAVRIGVLKVE